jgi:hypothetical protein
VAGTTTTVFSAVELSGGGAKDVGSVAHIGELSHSSSPGSEEGMRLTLLLQLPVLATGVADCAWPGPVVSAAQGERRGLDRSSRTGCLGAAVPVTEFTAPLDNGR